MYNSDIMLKNIIKYYKGVTNRALENLKNEKNFQFKKNLTNKTLEQATTDHLQKLNNSKQANKLIAEYRQAMRGMSEVAQTEYNRYLNIIKSTNDKDLKQKMLNNIANRGIHGFTGKDGKHWNIEGYSHMYTRHVNNQLIRLKVLENSNFDLFLVSKHGTICDLCKPYEGKYLVRQELEDSPLFHPFCKHFIIEVEDE